MSDHRLPRKRLPAGGSPDDEREDSELLRQMQAGEESALEVLYARYGGLIFTLALRIVGDPELAREVLQDTFLRSWDGREAYDPGRGRVPGWLMGIARNRAVDLLRSRLHQARLREREPLAGLAKEPGPRDAADAVTLRQAVASALRGLPIGQRQAIEMAYYGGHRRAGSGAYSAEADTLGAMKRSVLVLLLVLGGSAFPVTGEEIRVIHDQRPEPDIPREARGAGTKPDPDSGSGPRSNITFGIVTDLKDYGSLRNVMPRDIHAVTVRYYDGSFSDIQEVRRYLTSVLRSEKGSTTTYCPWAESLPVPSVEAVIQFASGEKGRLLLWRQGRLVYQDPAMKWWFAHGW